MGAETVAAIAAAFSGVNLLALLVVAFRAGRWMGHVDEKFRSIEMRLRTRHGEQPDNG